MLTVKMTHSSTDGAQRHVQMVASHLVDFSPVLAEAGKLIREETRMRFEARGFNEWPALSESTVARKIAKGYSQPTRQLYGEGDLFESATSAHGPHSYTVLTSHRIIVGVDWQQNGWQLAAVLSEGTEGTTGYRGKRGVFPRGGHSAAWGIPPRPIYPPKRALVNGISRMIRLWVKSGAVER